MIIVKTMGGLGNQMFQYALYKAIRLSGISAKLETSWHNLFTLKYGSGYELERVFQVNAEYSTPKEASRYGLLPTSKLNRALRKWKIIPKSHVVQLDSETEMFYYDSDLWDRIKKGESLFLDGYWGSQAWFLDYQDEIRKNYTFKNPLDAQNTEILGQIQSCQAVSVHARRYGVEGFTGLRETELEYYNRGIEFIEGKVENPWFFFFSNDIDWCKENFKLKNATFVDINQNREDAYKDMQLMSSCKHNIISNSTFSWWAAWLNSNPDKIVIAPEVWFGNVQSKDVLPKDWIVLDV